jgi:cholesterol transport system auxiliary component
MNKLAILMVLPLAVAISGCVRFGAEPPPSLLTLKPAAAVAVGETQRSAASITIAVPVTPQEIAGLRVPVHATDTSIAYLKDAVWVEPPARLFARLLSDTVAARTGRLVLSTRQSLSDPGAVMTGELRNFGVYATSGEVVVTFDASLSRENGGAFEKRRFEARVPAGAIAPGSVGVALNQAANRVADEVADWVGR